MESLNILVNKAKNDLMRKKNKYMVKEINLKFLANQEYQKNKEMNEQFKNKAIEERKKIKENYKNQERMMEQNIIVKNNNNEFNRFLMDIHNKCNLKETTNQHKNKITLKILENEHNINIHHLNNILDENIQGLNSEEIRNNKNTEIKLMELNLAKKKFNNKNKKTKKSLENKYKEELLKKRNDLNLILNEIQKQKIETKLRTDSNIMKNDQENKIEELKLNMELDINKKKIENEKISKLFNIEINKRAKMLDQSLKIKEDEFSLNIMASQIKKENMMKKQKNQKNDLKYNLLKWFIKCCLIQYFLLK